MDLVWDIFSDYLFLCAQKFDLKVISFVLMNNHFHMICLTPLGNIDQIMNYFLREVSREITFYSGRINQTFGGPYKWSLLDSTYSFQICYKYVYSNPISAGIVKNVEMYKYSTLHGQIGASHLSIPISYDPYLFDQTERTIRWINHGYTEEERNSISNGLRKSIFKIGKDKDRQLLF